MRKNKKVWTHFVKVFVCHSCGDNRIEHITNHHNPLESICDGCGVKIFPADDEKTLEILLEEQKILEEMHEMAKSTVRATKMRLCDIANELNFHLLKSRGAA